MSFGQFCATVLAVAFGIILAGIISFMCLLMLGMMVA